MHERRERLTRRTPKTFFSLTTLFMHGIWTMMCHLKNAVDVYIIRKIQQNLVGVRVMGQYTKWAKGCVLWTHAHKAHPSYSRDKPPELPVGIYVHKMHPLLFFGASCIHKTDFLMEVTVCMRESRCFGNPSRPSVLEQNPSVWWYPSVYPSIWGYHLIREYPTVRGTDLYRGTHLYGSTFCGTHLYWIRIHT